MAEFGNLSNLLSGLAGGLIGGLMTLVAVILTDCFKRKSKKRENEQILEALYRQAKYLWDFVKDIREGITKVEEDKAFTYLTVITQDYFSMFDNHSHLIGSLDDDEYSEIITKVYLSFKRLVDSLLSNDSLIKLSLRYARDGVLSKEPFFENIVNDFTARIIKETEQLKKHIIDLDDLLRQYEEAHENRVAKSNLLKKIKSA